MDIKQADKLSVKAAVLETTVEALKDHASSLELGAAQLADMGSDWAATQNREAAEKNREKAADYKAQIAQIDAELEAAGF